MELIEFLASIAPARSLAWDAGCGSGQLSVLLAERFEQVVATDASAEQIAQAEPRPNVEYRRATAEASGLSEGSADLAVAAQAAHWFDLPAYYREVDRATRPGAAVVLVTYGILLVEPEIDRAIMELYTQVLGPHWPPERRHVEDGYRSLAFPYRELVAPPLEVTATWDLAGLTGYLGTWSATRALEKAEGPGPFDAFCRDLTEIWGAADTRRLIRWPLSLRAGHRPRGP